MNEDFLSPYLRKELIDKIERLTPDYEKTKIEEEKRKKDIEKYFKLLDEDECLREFFTRFYSESSLANPINPEIPLVRFLPSGTPLTNEWGGLVDGLGYTISNLGGKKIGLHSHILDSLRGNFYARISWYDAVGYAYKLESFRNFHLNVNEIKLDFEQRLDLFLGSLE